MTFARSVAVETLDLLPPEDPRARRSRRDLIRIHRVMRSTPIVLAALRRVLPATPARPLRLVEIGCGDGTLMLDVARAAGDAWRGTSLVLLDRQPIVSAATIAAFANAGWVATPRVGDVLEWAGERRTGLRCDAVVATLFLHHFDGETLHRVLGGCAAHADAVVACEPRRSGFALLASRLVAFIGANAVTREDAVLSVKAGFAADELTQAWRATAGAGSGSPWRTDERDAGLFSHCFSAVRGEGGRA